MKKKKDLKKKEDKEKKLREKLKEELGLACVDAKVFEFLSPLKGEKSLEIIPESTA
jgi:hypothetical protein